MTKPGNAKTERTEQVEDLEALDDQVAKAAEAAATAAAHAVAAANAAEEISRVREEAEASAAKADTDATERSVAPAATSKVEESSETPEPTQPDLVPLDSDGRTEPGLPNGESVSNDEGPGLLNFDDPHVAMSSVLGRLALISLGSAAAVFVVSFLIVATVPKGTVFDVVVLVTWVGVVILSLCGFSLLVAAGIAKVIKSGERA